MMKLSSVGIVLGSLLALGGGGYAIVSQSNSNEKSETVSPEIVSQEQNEKETTPVPPPVTHIKTPTEVRAIYLSAWGAGAPSLRDPAIALADATDINAVVIDIKDASGKISFQMEDPVVQAVGSSETRITDIDELIKKLHDKNIYVIGRLTVFQDPFASKKNPDWALKTTSGEVWVDRKGLAFLNPMNKEVWDYTARIALESYNRGFDEINFDYIRFPSDGNLKILAYPVEGVDGRSQAIEEFFKYINTEVRQKGIPTSADLFGMTTTGHDDMGIGQVWEKALPYFDYLAPMIYPSHYPKNFIGLPNPAAEPKKVITAALEGAIEKTQAAGYPISVIRPWLQDFNMGAQYTPAMVKAQIDAGNALGIRSWLMWDPSNTYTTAAYTPEARESQ